MKSRFGLSKSRCDCREGTAQQRYKYGTIARIASMPAAERCGQKTKFMPLRGVLLQDLTWIEAQSHLSEQSLVVIPLGASAKEHGPHLRLDNDWTLAQYFAGRVLAAAEVVVAPTVGYHYYPAFVDYPGSVTLRPETARDLIVDICASLAAFGPRRFYVLNTGVSTLRPLSAAADVLAAKGLRLRYTDLRTLAADVVRRCSEQSGGTHADEIETSVMLYIAPDRVDMRKAVRDYHPGTGPLTRDRQAEGTYSPSGVYGDATLATWAKGRDVAEAMVAGMLSEIEQLRGEGLPPARVHGTAV
jgi:creatinine amidohydrolase